MTMIGIINVKVEIPCKYCGKLELECEDAYQTIRGFTAKYRCKNCKKRQVIYTKN